MSNKPEKMLKHALAYLEHGWNVLPAGVNKQPLVEWRKYQTERVTEQQVKEWWGKWPDAGVAVVTGAISGVVVIDAESTADQSLITRHLSESTLVCVSGGGGRHYYFKHPGQQVANASRFLPDIDCKGDGGIAVLPPSLHPSGKRYRWEGGKAKIQPLPAEIAKLLAERRTEKLSPDDWTKPVAEGGRDVRLTQLAGSLLRTKAPAAEVLSLLSTWNEKHCNPPLPDEQVEKIVRSIAGREAGKPGAGTPRGPMSEKELWRKVMTDEPAWLVEGWLQQGVCALVSGAPGTYKTWLLLALARSVATGKPFLGKYPVQRAGNVLLMQQEDPFNILASRLQMLAYPCECQSKRDPL